MEKNGIHDVCRAIRLAEQGTEMVFFTIAKTGPNVKKDRMIAFSGMKTAMEGGLLGQRDTLDLVIDIGQPLPGACTAAYGFTDEDMAGGMSEGAAAERISAFLGPSPILAGYGTGRADLGILKGTISRCTGSKLTPLVHIDVMDMVREKVDLADYSLKSAADGLMSPYGPSYGLDMRDISCMTLATARIFQIIKDDFHEDDSAGDPGLVIRRLNYWQNAPGSVRRIYVSTYPDVHAYYDIGRGFWSADGDTDTSDVRRLALEYLGVFSEEEMVKEVRARSAPENGEDA